MDSPHFMRLCFLLLTIATPCPNIAVPIDNLAEGTHDSAFGKTTVTVYHCKDCESNICKSSNYEDFEKIGETQSETFSNEIIQLVTSETRIIMCFQEGNTFPEGIYAIVWEKAIAIGDSCGILNSGASSENVRSNVVKICCEAATDPSMPSLPLKCYNEMSDQKAEKSTADITDEGNPGNPPFSVSERSNIGIIIPILIVAVCAAALATYCVRQNRNGQEQEVVQ
ncbi:uncharacterized protein LOC132318955 isoform X2 [Gavia stellata]|uniref:uncharacterized protein LOC132318955 isoform X2 n=1 Tax=Gavia stellata TaxID=37040 RepID=UPI00289C8919|nr:uncharacterized protein LOC132318955 isoform X2 [Gavia stellata]